MSGPREGSREIGEGIITSVPMDWHKTPAGIIPYKISARQREAAALANTVRQTDARSHVLGSLILQSYGAPPDAGTGVLSGTTNAECTPKTWSETVRAEGRNMVRHDDEWWMNNKNTWGRLAYVKDAATYPTPQVASITPQMSPPGGGEGSAGAAPVDGSRSPTAPTVAADGATAAAGGGDLRSYMAMAPGNISSPGHTDARSIEGPTKIPAAPNQAHQNDIVRVSADFPCQKKVGSYGSLDCPNEQAHKFVPDWTMGLSDKERRLASGDGRIPNMPSRDEMPAVCLAGDARDSLSEHGKVQDAADGAVRNLGNGFVARLGDVIHQSVKQTADELKRLQKGDCEKELQDAADKAFQGKNMDQLVRADPRSVKIFQGEMDWIMQPGGQTTRAPFEFLSQPQYKTGR